MQQHGTSHPSNIDTTSLLRACEGDRRLTAAAHLLIEHGVWLRRADFLDHTRTKFNGGHTWMLVDWGAVNDALDHDLVCSSSEHTVLAVALSLVGVRAVDLHQVLGRDLGEHARRCVLRSLERALGVG